MLKLISLLMLLSIPAFARTPVSFTNPGQSGFVFVLWGNYTDEAINGYLQRIKSSGATTLTVPLFGCQSSITSSDVGSCDLVRTKFVGISAEDRAKRERWNAVVHNREMSVHIAELAIQAGFQTTFLPIIATPQWDWRGLFNPKDVGGWFQSYEVWLKGVAADANRLGMKELIVGSEFSKLYAYSSQWSALLQNMHQVFSGPLIVTVNWGQLDAGFWDQADAIGISEYYPLTQSSSPTMSDLEKGASSVKATILSVAKKYQRPVYLTEIGFPSTVNAAKVPWTAVSTDVSDLQLQAECFQAFSDSWINESSLVRATVWATGDSGSPDFGTSYEILGKPAESVMKNFFTARSTH